MEPVRRNDEASTAAVVKALADEVNATLKIGGDGIRDAIDEDMMAAFAASGVTRRSIFVNGRDVGTLSLKPAKDVSGSEPVITNINELVDWMLDNDDGRRACRSLILSDPKKSLKWAIAEGVLPGGVEMREVTRTTKQSTTMTINRLDVLQALNIPEGGFILQAMLDPMLGLPSGEEGLDAEAEDADV